MYCEKNCYFCKNLYYFELENASEYFCTVSGLSYQTTKLKTECENFIIELEE